MEDCDAPLIPNPDNFDDISLNNHEVIHVIVDWLDVCSLLKLHVLSLLSLLDDLDGIIDCKYSNFVISGVNSGNSDRGLVDLWLQIVQIIDGEFVAVGLHDQVIIIQVHIRQIAFFYL